MESWSHVFMESWSHAVMQSCRHAIMQSWRHAVMESLQSWSHGVMESCNHAVMESCSHAVMESWSHTWSHAVLVVMESWLSPQRGANRRRWRWHRPEGPAAAYGPSLYPLGPPAATPAARRAQNQRQLQGSQHRVASTGSPHTPIALQYYWHSCTVTLEHNSHPFPWHSTCKK